MPDFFAKYLEAADKLNPAFINSLRSLFKSALLISLFCLYNNSIIYPQKRYENRVLLQDIDTSDPIKLLDEGRSIRDFPGYIIYIQEKDNNKVKDLIIYELNKKNESIISCIQAREGLIELDKSKYNKEHVTPFIRKSNMFKKSNLRSLKNFSNRRWTLDDKNDYTFIKKVYKFFYPKIYFHWMDIIKAEKKNKDLIFIKKRKLILE